MWRYPGLTDILRSPNTILLYPGPDAVDLSEVSLLDCGSASEGGNYQSYNVIILDGTWAQARGLYHQNEMLHWPRKVSRPLKSCHVTLSAAARRKHFLVQQCDCFTQKHWVFVILYTHNLWQVCKSTKSINYSQKYQTQ